MYAHAPASASSAAPPGLHGTHSALVGAQPARRARGRACDEGGAVAVPRLQPYEALLRGIPLSTLVLALGVLCPPLAVPAARKVPLRARGPAA